MKDLTIKYFILLISVFVVVSVREVNAQTEEILTSESLRRIEKANKIPDKPVYRDSVMAQLPVKYTSVATQAQTTIVPEPLKAANVIPKELLDKLYKVYTKLGLGNYTNVLGELYFNQERNATSDYGVHYKHFSSQGGINDVSFNGFSKNELSVYGSKFWNVYRGNAEFSYDREAFHYYGFQPDSFAFTKDQTKQIYNGLIFKLSGNTTYPNDTAKIFHRESLQFRPYFDNHGASEYNFLLDVGGSKKYKKELYGLGLTVDFNQINDDSCDCLTMFKEPVLYRCLHQQNNFILGLNPTVITYAGDLKMKVGLLVQGDIYASGKFYFFPDVDLSYSLFNDILIPYVGANRNIIRNSLYTLSKQNPFIVTNDEYINTNQNMHFYAGIRGTWSANLSFNSKVSYSQNQNVPLFIEDTVYSVQNRFAVTYDDIDIITADAHILFRTTSKWHLLFGGTYFNYATTNQTFAWNMPNFKIYSTFNYNLKDKIIIRYNLELLGTRKMYSLVPISGVEMQPDGKYIIDLKPYFDTDIQVEYRYTKRFSVFAHFNNLAGRYNRWLNYPTQSFNAMGGVTFMF
jgi:hypothetical protein